MNELLTETVIEEFLEEQPRAAYWQELTDALKERLIDARNMGDTKRIQELQGQIAVLAQETAITQFVEDSVRHSLARPRPSSLENVGALATWDEDYE
jgi:hypothetical protein